MGPLALGALGLGGAASFASIAAYRPALLALTAGLLGIGLYFSYRTPKAGVDACGCDRPGRRRGPRTSLWALALFTTLLAASPPLLARLSVGGPRPTARGPWTQVTVRVGGIDCEACVVPIRKALAEAGGLGEVRLDVPGKLVVEAGLEGSVSVRLVPVETDDDARRLGFLGSPTVRIDGEDVDPEGKGAEHVGLQCRLYPGEGRLEGIPPVA